MDPIELNPLDIAFLRSVGHVVRDIDSEERCLRVENYALADKLADAEEEIVRLDRMCRLLWGCIVLWQQRAISAGWEVTR